MKIKALIIDDEPLARNVIEQYAKKMPDLVIEGTCADAICAHQMLQEKSIDLLFLDINMPKLSGISFVRNLKNPPLIIFTTAYSEYALEGFELNAIDYLKKPFSFERFCQAFFKAEELIHLKKGIPADTELNNEFLFIKSNKKSVRVKFCEILYIEGLGDYIKIHLKDQKIVTNLSMKKIFSFLPENKFYRIHKSFIIALDHIDSIEGNLVEINKIKLPVGNNYRQDFMQLMERFSAE